MIEASISLPLMATIRVRRAAAPAFASVLKDITKMSTDDIVKGKKSLSNVAEEEVVHLKKPPDKCWLKPRPGWVKLNIDGSFKASDGSAGAGMVLRDEDGQVIFCACHHLNRCDDPFESEARACKEGIKLALQLSNKPIEVETDCSNLVASVLDKELDRSPFAFVISAVKFFFSGDRNISLVKVDRSQNRVSHCLANFARAEAHTMVWHGSGPDCVRQALDHDLVVSPTA
jgi:ribonuclease HI